MTIRPALSRDRASNRIPQISSVLTRLLIFAIGCSMALPASWAAMPNTSLPGSMPSAAKPGRQNTKTRGGLTAPPVSSTGLPVNRVRWAVIIGCNEYDPVPPNLSPKHVFGRLDNPNSDATALGKLLQEEYGFKQDHIFVLTDEAAFKADRFKGVGTVVGHATRENILALFGLRALHGHEVTAQDALFVFFAGHGHSNGTEGYLVPEDVRYTHTDVNLQSLVSFRDLLSHLKAVNAKNTFIVCDSCFSGSFFRATVETLIKKQASAGYDGFSIQGLTAGEAGQPVSDGGGSGLPTVGNSDEIAGQKGGVESHSVFTSSLLQVLSSGGIRGDDTWRASDLSAIVSQKVRDNQGANKQGQDPQFGYLDGNGNGKDFLFQHFGKSQPPWTYIDSLGIGNDNDFHVAGASVLLSWAEGQAPSDRYNAAERTAELVGRRLVQSLQESPGTLKPVSVDQHWAFNGADLQLSAPIEKLPRDLMGMLAHWNTPRSRQWLVAATQYPTGVVLLRSLAKVQPGPRAAMESALSFAKTSNISWLDAASLWDTLQSTGGDAAADKAVDAGTRRRARAEILENGTSRIDAAVWLLNMGDATGLPTIELAGSSGSAEESAEIARLLVEEARGWSRTGKEFAQILESRAGAIVLRTLVHSRISNIRQAALLSLAYHGKPGMLIALSNLLADGNVNESRLAALSPDSSDPACDEILKRISNLQGNISDEDKNDPASPLVLNNPLCVPEKFCKVDSIQQVDILGVLRSAGTNTARDELIQKCTVGPSVAGAYLGEMKENSRDIIPLAKAIIYAENNYSSIGRSPEQDNNPIPIANLQARIGELLLALLRRLPDPTTRDSSDMDIKQSITLKNQVPVKSAVRPINVFLPQDPPIVLPADIVATLPALPNALKSAIDLFLPSLSFDATRKMEAHEFVALVDEIGRLQLRAVFGGVLAYIRIAGIDNKENCRCYTHAARAAVALAASALPSDEDVAGNMQQQIIDVLHPPRPDRRDACAVILQEVLAAPVEFRKRILQSMLPDDWHQYLYACDFHAAITEIPGKQTAYRAGKINQALTSPHAAQSALASEYVAAALVAGDVAAAQHYLSGIGISDVDIDLFAPSTAGRDLTHKFSPSDASALLSVWSGNAPVGKPLPSNVGPSDFLLAAMTIAKLYEYKLAGYDTLADTIAKQFPPEEYSDLYLRSAEMDIAADGTAATVESLVQKRRKSQMADADLYLLYIHAASALSNGPTPPDEDASWILWHPMNDWASTSGSLPPSTMAGLGPAPTDAAVLSNAIDLRSLMLGFQPKKLLASAVVLEIQGRYEAALKLCRLCRELLVARNHPVPTDLDVRISRLIDLSKNS